MVAGQIAFRRWRHLFTFVGSVFVLEAIGAAVYTGFARPRPYGVTTIGRWAGYSMPSPPVGVLAAILIGVAYTLVVPGPPRRIAKAAIAVVLVTLAAARLYLGVDHPFDILVGTALGVAIPLAAFRLFTPNDVFPVAYGRGKTAHLDVGGARGEALRRTVGDQLGLTIVGDRARGAGGIGRLDAPAADGGGRPRDPPLRQALRHEPRARRPLVQARPHHPLRAARGRDAVPVRAAPRRSTRTTPCGCCATWASRPPSRTASSRSPRPASTSS